MEVNLKAYIGSSVFFFDGKKGKICEGKVSAINVFLMEDKTETTYVITPKDGRMFSLRVNVDESLVFRNWDDVLDFCCNLTEGIE